MGVLLAQMSIVDESTSRTEISYQAFEMDDSVESFIFWALPCALKERM